MRFPLNRLRGIFRLPVIIFLILVLGSCLTTYGFVYLTLTTHLEGDYFRVKNEYLETIFPKNWFGWEWEEENATIGNSYTLLLGSTTSLVAMTITLYDEKATDNFLTGNNLTDSFSVVIHLANAMYNQSLENNENATLVFVKNGTRRVSNNNADYTEFQIKGVKIDEDLYNWTITYFSFIDQKRLVYISFQGKDEDWMQTYNIFEVMLESIKV